MSDSKEKRMTNRERQAMETKEKIYKAGMKVLSRNGFNNLTIAAICKEAGVSVGSFYVYYSSKEDLIVSHYYRFDQFLEEKKAEIECDDPIASIGSFFKLYADYHLSFSLELNKQWYAPAFKVAIPEERATFSILTDLIRQAQSDGIFDPSQDASTIMQELMMFARGVVLDWLYQNGEYDLSAKLTDVIARVLTLYKA